MQPSSTSLYNLRSLFFVSEVFIFSSTESIALPPLLGEKGVFQELKLEIKKSAIQAGCGRLRSEHAGLHGETKPLPGQAGYRLLSGRAVPH